MSVSEQLANGTKRCRDCCEVKPLSEFPPAGRSPDGRASYCRSCYRTRSKASYRKRRAEQGRQVRETVPVPDGHKRCPNGVATYCKPCHNARAQKTRQRLYGGGREYHLRRRYGIGQSEVDAMLVEQGGVCAVCGKPDPEHVDHDHATGRVRGMLCFNCNQALGNVRDSVEVLEKLQYYLFDAARRADAAPPTYAFEPPQVVVWEPRDYKHRCGAA